MHLRDLLNGNGSGRGFLQIISGTLAGQTVTLLALPFLTRLYSPEQYGEFALLMSLSALGAPLLLLGMDQAVVKPSASSEVASMVRAGVLGLLVTSVGFGVVVSSVPFFGRWPLLVSLRFFLPLSVFVLGISMLLTQLHVRDRNYRSIGVRNSIQSVCTTGLQVTFGLGSISQDLNGLVAGYILGTLIGCFVLLLGVDRRYLKATYRTVRQTVVKEWQFPIVFAPSVVLAQLAQQFPLLYFAATFGSEAAGHVGMAERLVAVPTALVGLAGASVFTGDFSTAVRRKDGSELRIFRSFVTRLGLLGALSFLAFLCLVPPLIPTVLGEQWVGTERIIQGMSIIVLSRMLATPLRSTFRVIGGAKFLSGFEILRACGLVLAGWALTRGNADLMVSVVVIYSLIAFSDLVLVLGGYRQLIRFTGSN